MDYMIEKCSFCDEGERKIIKSNKGKFAVECSCGARGIFEDDEAKAVKSWNKVFGKSHLEMMEEMLKSSEFSSVYEKVDSVIECADGTFETVDILIKDENPDVATVDLCFLKSSEECLGVIVEKHQCNCGKR